MAISEREKTAVRLFASGVNCAQAVLMTYADIAGLTQEQAARLLGVSQVQVSRLERRALEKLRASLSDEL